MTNAKLFPQAPAYLSHEIIEQCRQKLCTCGNQSKVLYEAANLMKRFPSDPELWVMLDQTIPIVLRKMSFSSDVHGTVLEALTFLFDAYFTYYPTRKIPPASYAIAAFSFFHREVVSPESGTDLSVKCRSKVCEFALALARKHSYYDLRNFLQQLEDADFLNAELYFNLVLWKLGHICYHTQKPLPHGFTASLPKDLDTGWKMMQVAQRNLLRLYADQTGNKRQRFHAAPFEMVPLVWSNPPVQVRLSKGKCNSDGLELCKELLHQGVLRSPGVAQYGHLSPEQQESLAFAWVHKL